MNNIQQLENQYFPVLDHGFCAVVDHMGDDHSIARAARCSYGEGTKKTSNDRGLIRTLMRDKHTSPFEMCELVLHVGMPIFVARQWVRHRTASLNEYSGRYSVMPMLFYTPTPERHQTQDQSNKQGSSPVTLDLKQQAMVSYGRSETRDSAVRGYQDCLGVDLSRELARIDLPLSTYTYWYWKIDLKNLLGFLSLRLDQHAQWEIQQYAKVIAGIVKEWLPMTWEAFDDYALNGISFSRQEQAILLNIINTVDFSLLDQLDCANIEVQCKDLNMSVRETDSFFEKVSHLGGGQFVDTVDLDLSTAKTPEFYEQQIKAAAETQDA